MVKIGLVGNLVQDVCIGVRNKDSYERYHDGLSIEEVIEISDTPLSDSGIASEYIDDVHYSFGGPPITWAQYLRPHHDVSIIGVGGNDTQSLELKPFLRENLGINVGPGGGIKWYGGKLSRFALVYRTRPRKDDKGKTWWDQKVYWEGNVADKQFENIDDRPSVLGENDILALTITEPELSLRAAEIYHDANPGGKLILNLGRYLTRDDYSWDDSYFEELITHASWVFLNDPEAEAVMRNIGISRLSLLFERSSRLELIAQTSKRGSDLFVKKGTGHHYSYRAEPQEVHPGYQLGCGDAFSATLLDLVFRCPALDLGTSQRLASQVAVENLGHIGALTSRRINEDSPSLLPVQKKTFRVGKKKLNRVGEDNLPDFEE